jgi:hypothetical protein
MRKSTWIHALLATAVVVAVGALVAAAGEHQIKIKKASADEVTVITDGVTEVITLEDLADGQERSFTAGDHEVVVKRQGESLVVALDGQEVGPHGDMAHAMAFVTTDGDSAEVHKKVVVKKMGAGERDLVWTDEEGLTRKITVEVGDDGEHVVLIDGEALEGAANVFVTKMRGGSEEEIDVMVGHPLHGPAMIHAHADQVVYRCTEDGTKVILDKDKATQESYACPVCGRLMEKVEVPQMKVMTFVTEDCDPADCEDDD